MEGAIAWLTARYGDVKITSRTSEGETLRISMRPRGELPVPVDVMEVEIHVTSSFPAEAATISVLCGSCGGLPPPIVRAINVMLSRLFSAPSSLRGGNIAPALRWLDNHIDDVLTRLIALQAELEHVRDSGSAEVPVHAASDEFSPPGRMLDSKPPIDAGEKAAVEDAVSPQLTRDTDLTMWPYDAHRRWEAAVRRCLLQEGRSASDPQTWMQVAQFVANAVSANMNQNFSATPVQCCARYIILRTAARVWYQQQHPSAVRLRTRAQELDHSYEQGVTSDNTSSLARHNGVREHEAGVGAAPMNAAVGMGLRGTDTRSTSSWESDWSNSGDEEYHSEGDACELASDRDAATKYAKRCGKGGVAIIAAQAVDTHAQAAVAAGAGTDNSSLSVRSTRGPEEVPAVNSVPATIDATAVELSDGVDDNEKSAEAGVGGAFGPAFRGVDISATAARGTALSLNGLLLHGVGAMVASRVGINVQCTRCGTVVGSIVSLKGADVNDASMRPPGAPFSAPVDDSASVPSAAPAGGQFREWCTKCSLLLSLAFRPTLMFDGSGSGTATGSTMGYVDTTHARVTGVVDASFLASCLECGAISTVPRFAPPCTHEVACRTCYLRLRIAARASRVEVVLGMGDGGEAGDGHLHRPRVSLQRFAPGKPLPDRGACKHYKHSYRWLRFPCCGVAFPCDTCHDERSDHVHEWAKRMICGSCAREQPWSNEPCISCGARMGRSAMAGPRSRFWEGGSGQRDQRMLSRNDSRKHKGEGKTSSKRASRVGPKKDRPLDS